MPSSASSGPLTVIANGVGSNENFAFTFYNPVIMSITPAAAPAGGSVTLAGNGFGNGFGSGQASTLQLNGAMVSVSSWSDTSVSFIVPSNAGSGAVTVTVGGVISNSVQFSLIEATSITGISPSSGAVNSSVTITGTGFGPTQSNSVFSFYGAAATNITSWSDTSIVAVVPARRLQRECLGHCGQ